MGHVWRITRVELAQLWRSRAFVAMAVIVAALLLTGAVVSWQAQDAFDAQRTRYQNTVAAQWTSQPARHPHRVAHYGYLLFRPRGALTFFDPGVTPFTGSTVFLEAHRQNSMNYADVEQADSPLALGGLSMAGVLHLLLPLVIFVAAAGLVAREREDGTLALLRAQGTRWPALLGGKTLALLVVAGAIVVPGVLAAALGLWWQRGAHVGGASAAALAALVTVHAIYLVTCATIGVLVSAHARRPATRRWRCSARGWRCGSSCRASDRRCRRRPTICRRGPSSRRRSSDASGPSVTATTRTTRTSPPSGPRCWPVTASRASRICRSTTTGC